MRPIVIGLFVAALATALMPAAASAATASTAPAAKPAVVDPVARQKGMAAAPGAITAAGLDCTLADARMIGTSQDPKTKVSSNFYEVACKDNEGFIISVPASKDPPAAYTCLEVAASANAGVACILPANLDIKAGLATLVAKDEPSCVLANARGVGHSVTDAVTEFEVSCQNGADYIVDASYPLSPAKPAKFNPCIAYGAEQATKCTLEPIDAQNAFVDALAAKDGKPCDVTARRFVGTAADGSSFYEVACKDGKGYMVQVATAGTVQPGIPCTEADGIAGGCTLTNAREAETQEADLYSKLAKRAGYNCAVSKYSPFEVSVPKHEVVELACSNRPDGAVAVLGDTDADTSTVYDCAHSQLAGYRCSFTDANAAIATLTDDLKKLGKTSCVVSGQRFIADTVDKHGYIEVTCSDGNPGYIIDYNTDPVSPKEATTCSFAKDVLGGCTMPGNMPKKG